MSIVSQKIFILFFVYLFVRLNYCKYVPVSGVYSEFLNILKILKLAPAPSELSDNLEEKKEREKILSLSLSSIFTLYFSSSDFISTKSFISSSMALDSLYAIMRKSLSFKMT